MKSCVRGCAPSPPPSSSPEIMSRDSVRCRSSAQIRSLHFSVTSCGAQTLRSSPLPSIVARCMSEQPAGTHSWRAGAALLRATHHWLRRGRASREESDDPAPHTASLGLPGDYNLQGAARPRLPRAGVSIRGLIGSFFPLRPAAELSTVLKDEPERGSGAAHPPLLVRHQGKKTAAGCAPLLRGSTSRSWKEILCFFSSLKSKVVRCSRGPKADHVEEVRIPF